MTDDELRRKIAEAKGIEYEVLTFVVGNEYVYKDEEKDQFTPIPDWPVSIADAFELLESDEVYGYKLLKPVSWPWKHQCWIMPKIHPMQKFSAEADTAPRAICLAYLAWKEAQK